MKAALEAGDIEAARIANETIAKLLGAAGAEPGAALVALESAR